MFHNEQNDIFIYRENQTDLQRVCSDTVELLAGCKVCQQIETSVTDQLKELFGDKYQQVSLAVRSSANGKMAF